MFIEAFTFVLGGAIEHNSDFLLLWVVYTVVRNIPCWFCCRDVSILYLLRMTLIDHFSHEGCIIPFVVFVRFHAPFQVFKALQCHISVVWEIFLLRLQW